MASNNNWKEKQNLSKAANNRQGDFSNNGSRNWRSYSNTTQHNGNDRKKPVERYFYFHCTTLSSLSIAFIYRDANNWRKPAASEAQSFQRKQQPETSVM